MSDHKRHVQHISQDTRILQNKKLRFVDPLAIPRVVPRTSSHATPAHPFSHRQKLNSVSHRPCEGNVQFDSHPNPIGDCREGKDGDEEPGPIEDEEMFDGVDLTDR